MPSTKESNSSGQLNDDIVITGISGRYPESNNVEEFKNNLFDGVNMVTEDDRRWKPGVFGTPKGMGKLKNIDFFDNMFFEVHGKQADMMDPALFALLETTYEAIFDSGFNPFSLRGNRIGVFVGNGGPSFPEPSWMTWAGMGKYAGLGQNSAMFSNRISYSFDFKGPSITVDTACSSSFTALNYAILALKSGQCEAAIVAGATLTFRLIGTVFLDALGILSHDSRCKTFDSSADGMARAESVCAIFLQRRSDARRVYATVLDCKECNDGKKIQGITYPSGEVQTTLMREMYDGLGISPSSIRYFEAHGTGTKAGDKIEGTAIQDALCVDRKEPLLVGAVKSSTGHSEHSSGLVSITKVIISMEEGMIPANLHFKEPNPDIPAFSDGRIKVVSENTPFPGGFVAINNFGFGGSNVHLLLSPNISARCEPAKERSIPRLVLSCGRTEKSVLYILNTVKERNFNDNALALLEDASKFSTRMRFKGYSLLEGSGSNPEDNITVKAVNAEQRPVWFLYSGMGSQWSGMAKDMMRLEPFAKSIMSSAEILKPLGVDLIHLLTEATNVELNHIVAPFVTIAAVQIALTQLLKSMDVEPDGIVGHSVGELGCAYADGCLTAEQMLIAAYWRGKSCLLSTLIHGKMAAVGMSWDEAVKRCPDGVFPVCNNAKDSVTISGAAAEVLAFIEQLKAESIFVREVKTGDIAFHCKYVAPAAKIMKQKLKEVIPNPTARTPRWISSSVPEEKWHQEEAKYSSVDYHVNNLLSSVLFDQAMAHVPQNALIIEISPHSLLEAIIRRTHGANACYVGLMKRNQPNNLKNFLESVGKLYTLGVNPSVKNLYSPVIYPVPSGTPMLNSLIVWDHSQQFRNWNFQAFYKGGTTLTLDTHKNGPYEYLIDHKVDGRVLFPATGYIWLAWKIFANSLFLTPDEMPVVLEDIQFLRASVLPKDGKYLLQVSLLQTSGAFTIHDKGVLLVKGRIRKAEDEETQIRPTPELKVEKENEEGKIFTLDAQDFYKELRLRGYDYGPCFQSVAQVQSDGLRGLIRWTDNWVTFIDSILQLGVMHDPYRMLVLPTKIQRISIDPSKKPSKTGQEIPASFYPWTNRCVCGPVEIQRPQCLLAPRNPVRDGKLMLEEYRFTPYFDLKALSDEKEAKLMEYSQVCSTLAQRVLKYTGRNDFFSLALNDTEPASDQLIQKYVTLEGNDYVLLNTLHDILSANTNSESHEALTKQLGIHDNQMRNDFISTLPFAENVLRDILSVVLDNHASIKINLLEVTHRNVSYPHVYDCLKIYLTTLTLNYTIARTSKDNITEYEKTVKVIDVDPEDLCLPSNHDLVIGKDVFTDNGLSARRHLNVLASSVKDNGFILLMERTALLPAEQVVQHLAGNKRKCINENDLEELFAKEGLVVVAKKRDRSTFVSYLLRKTIDSGLAGPVVYIIDETREYSWVEELQKIFEEEKSSEMKRRIWIASDNQETGIIGLMNVLRFEENGQKLRYSCSGSMENGRSQFDLNDKTVQELVRKDLRSNVYRNQQWGIFLLKPLDRETPKVKRADVFLNTKEHGNLSGVRWIESPLKYWCPQDKNYAKVQVFYSALNFRDVMLASGKLQTTTAQELQLSRDCRIGFEFSGVEEATGRCVMGIVPCQGIASSIVTTKEFLLNVPPQWTLEEASSVPMVYLTSYYALIVRGRLRRGQSVLIHSGSGGVGQAAISICLDMKCDVYTTVGSDEKKEDLLFRFPELNRENIFNSRTLDFEAGILNRTTGKGVDVVLNSLADDKLQASVRCLRPNGKFLELGKYDIMMDHPLGLGHFMNNIEFHGVSLNNITTEEYREEILEVISLFNKGVKSGVVKPLPTTIYSWEEAEEAFRFLASGKHIGKVVIKIRDEATNALGKVQHLLIPSVPQTYFDPSKSVVVTGGLGGLGFELCHWLIRRGVRHIAISSRSGLKNNYQRLWIKRWTEQGIKVAICNQDIVQYEGCRDLLEEANAMAPVGSIFHLAMVLINSPFNGVTREDFIKTCNPKLEGLRNLDVLSRKLCPELEHFCAFSSAVASRGTPGLSCYAYANSAMEELIQRRRDEGFCGQAFEYGAIGEAGILYEEHREKFTENKLKGTAYQSIDSCLVALDSLIQRNLPITLSFVQSSSYSSSSDHPKDLVHLLRTVLGIPDEKNISPDTTLGNLGMDSLMVVEAKHILEAEYDTQLDTQDIFKLTILDIRFYFSYSKSYFTRDSFPKRLPTFMIKLRNSTESRAFVGFSFGTPSGIFGTPKGMGKLKDIGRFDNLFFEVHGKQASMMDPALFALLETTYEAIFDSGFNPFSLSGNRIGVFVGNGGPSLPEPPGMVWTEIGGYVGLGQNSAMLANRISYSFNFKGPSLTVDTACSSSFTALNYAILALKSGQCEAAIVAGATISLRFLGTRFLDALGILSPDAKCKTFDASANGIARSESIICIFLQRRSDARRIYVTVLGCKACNDGKKLEGITHPSVEVQTTLMREMYDELGISPSSIRYFEAHGTGTKAGDYVEGTAIQEVLCVDRKEPLLVGAVKSNTGHAECTSGLVSITKVIISMEEGIIPANLHFKEPNPDISALSDGRMKLILENTPFPGGIVAINNFGFGGSNVHLVLRPNISARDEPARERSIPRLVLSCGRTENSVRYILKTVQEKNFNDHALALLEDASKFSTRMRFRGYSLLEGSGLSPEDNITVKEVNAEQRPVWFLYSGMGSQWSGMAKDMMRLEPFAKSIMSSAEILKPLGVDLLHLLTEATNDELNYIVAPFVTIAAVQIALTQLLKSMNVEPDGIVGHSVGELGCAYADGCLTAEQMLLAAYWRGKSCVLSTLIFGKMAAVGMSWDEAVKRCPDGVFPVCNNAKDSVTISGPAAEVLAFIEQLKTESVFVREVKTGDIAFHCKYVAPAAEIMKQKLKEVIPNPTARTSRWISSSVPEEKWEQEQAKYSSVDYHINNLLSSVLFDQAMAHVPKNALIIEISPHSLLEAIVRRTLGADTCYVGLMKRNQPNNLKYFLESVGKLYTLGVHPNVKNLYSPVIYPVPPGTPMLNSLIVWDHSQQFIKWNFKNFHKDSKMLTLDTHKNGPHEYLIDHKVDGRVLFPASGYIWLAWKILANSLFLMPEEIPVVLEDIQFLRAAVLPKDGKYLLEVSLLETSGAFTIHDKGLLLVRGRIRRAEDEETQVCSTPEQKDEQENKEGKIFTLDAQSFYKELRLRGYDYGPCFQNVAQVQSDGLRGLIRWTDNWVTFIDTILHLGVMHDPYRMLVLPTKIQKMSVDPSRKPSTKGQEIPALFNPWTNRCVCGPVEIQRPQCLLAPRNPLRDGELVLREYRFTPYFDLKALSDEKEARLKEYSHVCSTLAQRVLKYTGRNDFFSLALNDTVPAADELVQKYLTREDNDYILLNTLHGILSANTSSESNEAPTKQLGVHDNQMRNDFISTLPFAESVLKDTLDVVLDNHFSIKFNVLEITHRNASYPHVYECLKPYLTVTLTLNYTMAKTSKEDITERDEAVTVIEVDLEELRLPSNQDLVVTKDVFTEHVLSARAHLNVLASSVKDNGFILLMERTALLPAEQVVQHLAGNKRKCINENDLEELFAKEGLVVVGKKKDRSSFVSYLLRKISDSALADPVVYRINETREYSWVEELQKVLEEEKSSEAKRRIWISSDHQETGMVGLMNTLRFEENGHRLRFCCNCSLEEGRSQFDLNEETIQELVRKDFRSNVYRNQQWGMFLFRYLDRETPKVERAESFLSPKEYGNISGLRWIESPLKYWTPQHKNDTKVQVFYSALNFRDVMIASGKLQTVTAQDLQFSRDCRIGFEFSGVEEVTGRRVMGIIPCRAVASSVITTKELLLDVPPHWTLEEASSVPIVYLTSYYALTVRGRLRRGQSVLIHSGTGGVGQAAISICLDMKCDVYTTVGSEKKKEYLMLRFPELKRENIFNSRTLNFEADILNRTTGEGVDIVLNSLAEDKLQASVRCIRTNGKFLEIGMYDIMMDHPLGLGHFTKNIEFHGISMFTLMGVEHREVIYGIISLFNEGIERGVVKPLPTTVYSWENAEEAFRFLASGKHIGKVVMKIRDEATTDLAEVRDLLIPSVPQTYFDPTKSVVVTGGLGGLGFELCHWLIRRGVRHIAISSRSGIKNSYQRLWIKRWTEQGIKVAICNHDIVQIEGCRDLLEEANSMATVGSIFHLALVLTNSLFNGVTREDFIKTCNPKLEALRNLDIVSRELCPQLEHFCAFSSVIASTGSPGLGSYAYANSAMEKLIERRRNQGFCGQAVEYGAIGEVGILYEEYRENFNTTRLKGTEYQSVDSCLAALDRLIQQNLPVTLSVVRSRGFGHSTDKQQDLVHLLCNILGVPDEKELSPDTTLGNLGMDSLMVVEAKHILESDYDTVLNVQEILKLTIRELREISNKKMENRGPKGKEKQVNPNEKDEPITANGNDDNLSSKKEESLAELFGIEGKLIITQ